MPTVKRIAAAFTLLVAGAAQAVLPAPGTLAAPDDPRYCGEPTRDKNGEIVRSTTQLRRFVEVFPCPATLRPTISCTDWQIDHVLPIGSGGCDKPINMQWLPKALKTCAGKLCKDRWERTYHTLPRHAVALPVPAGRRPDRN